MAITVLEQALTVTLLEDDSLLIVPEDRISVVEMNTGMMGPPGQSVDQAIEFIIGDGINVVPTGVKGYFEVPFDATILGWTLVADAVGSIAIDVWKDTYANFPPTVADTIVGTEKPTLTAQQKNRDFSLTTWDTSLIQGDWFGIKVDSSAVVKQVTLSIRVMKA